MPKQLPLKAMQAFEHVARHGSVTKAALELGVSPGAVSQQIRKLEEHLGLHLLERSGKGVELTSWGRMYQKGLAAAFDDLRQTHAALDHARASGGLVVSCLASVASRWIGPKLFDWHALHPAAKVRLIGAEAEPVLHHDPFDFRISYGEKSKGFAHFTELFTDWVVPACAPSLIAGHDVSTADDVLRHPLIGIEWEQQHRPAPTWREWAASVGGNLRRVETELAFSLSSSALDAAVNGHGFALAQMAMIAEDLAAGRLVIPFDHRLQLSDPYFLAWDRAALDKPFGTEFRAWVVALSKSQAKLSAGG
ncbi:LysR family transcriptional regulator [Bosea sp. Tri-44]|uniref:LysR family transcriptional regulator n=1 Tax=Bosea sp. Tri-44 TaxID=1972137 RepID=UPI0020C12A25|nr:LysR family transcriptional regulator [Bosea sp. Tri-44]